MSIHPAFRHTDHRPWPVPSAEWTWRQTWRDLLFLHWPIKASALRPLVPRELSIDECEGSAWLSVVPFRMTGVMRRSIPDLPWISAFPELNVRTYVTHGQKRGVWFFSLDASNPLAVWAARTFFHLPYHVASMRSDAHGEEIRYGSVRNADRSVCFSARYAPVGNAYLAQDESLDHFLTERYCLYARTQSGTILRNDVHHAPWPLQHAEFEIEQNTMTKPLGFDLPAIAPIAQFAKKLDVVVWNAERVDR